MKLHIEMELLSDAILSAGYSIPGGEDIAVCQDEDGYPLLRGSTLKGLLREGLTNWCAWTGTDPAAIADMLGKEGWDGAEHPRRIHLTSLTLLDPPDSAEDCYETRIFTRLEEGVAASGSLRMAACIRCGLRFGGHLFCDARDASILQNALQAIKWVGTLRSRGFGRVRFYLRAGAGETALPPLPAARCIHYRLRTRLPVLITDPGRSSSNSYETRGCIPGSAIRGLVLSALASRQPDFFQAHRQALLSDSTRFLDALPNPAHLPALPAIQGFYEDKSETRFESVVAHGAFTPGLKRAHIGSFCALEGEELLYWSARTGGATRILRADGASAQTRPFQVRYLRAGQDFDGYIQLDDPALAPGLGLAFTPTVWLGADRCEGFGECAVLSLEAVDAPDYLRAYGARREDAAVLYLLALSPLCMQNALGEPCGLDEGELAAMLGVPSVEVEHCSTSLVELGGYNRAWRCRTQPLRMYDRGSIFKLRCGRAPAPKALQKLESSGIGMRREAGCGQVLLLGAGLFEGISRKRRLAPPGGESDAARRAAVLRRARCQYIMEKSPEVQKLRLSRSQLGTIQALCERAIARGEGPGELYGHLEHNLTGRGALHGARFTGIQSLIRDALERPLGATLGLADCPDSIEARMRLLCALFNYSRKGEEL